MKAWEAVAVDSALWAACLPLLAMPISGPASIFGVIVISGLCANGPCRRSPALQPWPTVRVANRNAARPASLRSSPSKAGNLTGKVVG